MVHISLKPGLENLGHYFASILDESSCAVVEYSLALPFFGIGMKTDLFQSCDHCWVFQIFWHIECSTFTTSSFRNWNSSTVISSPPLALFVVMLPKAHLSSHSRMSGSGWVITPLWLSGSWRSCLYCSSVYFCHFFLISPASVRSLPFLSCIDPIFAWNVPLLYWFFKEISSLSHSIVFLYLFALITEEGFISSPCYSLELCIQLGISFPFSIVFSFSSFFSYLQVLLRQPFCLFVFLFLGNGFVPCLLYNVTNFCP